MADLIQSLNGVRLRRIEVPDWDCPVAAQSNIRALPTLWLYDGRNKISADTGEVLQRLAERR